MDKKSSKKIIVTVVCSAMLAIVIIFSVKKCFFNQKQINIAKAPKSVAKQKAETHKDTDIMSGYNIIYSANKNAVAANEVEQMLEAKYKEKNKYVFLTFDDGPSQNTSEILKILNEKDVRATFFVVGSHLKNEKDKELLKKEIEDGNAIANHSYSHDYKKLYPGNVTDLNYFIDEVNKTNKEMQSILGDNFNCRVLRMPGGYMSRKYYRDPNLKGLNEFLEKEHIVNLDWDAETGDATGKKLTTEEMVQNAGKYISTEDHVILLMHDADAKVQTVKALPSIIDFFKSKGYEFKIIKNSAIEKNKN